jgi:hypothetical protein
VPHTEPSIRERITRYLKEHPFEPITTSEVQETVGITREQAKNGLHSLARVGLQDSLRRISGSTWKYEPQRLAQQPPSRLQLPLAGELDSVTVHITARLDDDYFGFTDSGLAVRVTPIRRIEIAGDVLFENPGVVRRDRIAVA